MERLIKLIRDLLEKIIKDWNSVLKRQETLP